MDIIRTIIICLLFSSCSLKYEQIEVNQFSRTNGVPISYAKFNGSRGINQYSFQSYEYVYLTREANKLVTASALYFVPKKPSGKLVLLAHATIGINNPCSIDRPFFLRTHEEFISELLKEQYIVVVPNYRGLGISDTKHKYLNAQEAAMDVLDALSASITLFKLANNIPIILLGLSQGGQATQRAAEMTQRYTPQLNIIGSVQISPPLIISTTLDQALTGELNLFQYIAVPYIVSGLVRSHPELTLKDYFNSVFVKRQDDGSGLGCYSAFFKALLISNPITTDRNIAKEKIQIATEYLIAQDAPKYRTKIPLLLITAKDDFIVTDKLQHGIKDKLCQQDFIIFEAIRKGGHMDSKDVQMATKWIRDRFNGLAPPNSCTDTE